MEVRAEAAIGEIEAHAVVAVEKLVVHVVLDRSAHLGNVPTV